MKKQTDKQIFYIIYYKSKIDYRVTYTGYYVKYKDKCSDEYSDNYIFAKRYTSLNTLLSSRIGITMSSPASIMDFLNKIERNKNFLRLKKLNKITDTNTNLNISLLNILNFKIERVEIEGHNIKLLDEVTIGELYETLKAKCGTIKAKNKVFEPLKVKVDYTTSDDDFWN